MTTTTTTTATTTTSSTKRGKSREPRIRSKASSSSVGRSDSGVSSGGGSSTDDVPTSMRRLKIQPLSTVGDAGKPTASVARDLRRVVNFIRDERHLVAYELYRNVKERWQAMLLQKQELDAAARAAAAGTTNTSTAMHDGSATSAKGSTKVRRSWIRGKSKASAIGATFNKADFDDALELVQKHKDDFNLLMKRAPLFLQCRDNMDVSEGWTLAQTLFGVTTYYRREEDQSLSIKLEGELVGIPLFEQVAVLREIDLHCHWAPFVTSSLTLAHLDKLDTVGWFMVGLPNFGIARDSCFRAMGCDCVAEDMSVLLVGRGIEDRLPGAPNTDEAAKFLVEDPVLKELDIPAWPTRMGSGRLTMKMFEAKIKILGPDRCHTYILANLDPNLAFIPQALLEFVMKKLCGFLLNKMQTAAKKITRDPVRNVHAQRIRDESAFYKDWLLPKFEAVAADRGWEVPTISAFELTESQQVEVRKWNDKRTNKMHSFSYVDTGDDDDKVDPGSTRSEPDLHHSSNLDDRKGDDASDISSLSGTSASIWKNNPISSYLRDVEKKTQDRKTKAAQEAKRVAAARLRRRPLPVDRKERLNELRNLKQQKMYSRGASSSYSVGPLPAVDETDGDTVATGRTTATVTTEKLKPRLVAVFCMIVVLSILLKAAKFLPWFWQQDHGFLAGGLRDLAFLLYLCLCGLAHFAICDMLSVYGFEALELGMKSGEPVKKYFRANVRVAIASLSGLMVLVSISKAALLALLEAAISGLKSFIVDRRTGVVKANYDENVIALDILSDVFTRISSNFPESFALVSGSARFLVSGFAAFYDFSYTVFNWQMNLIRSIWIVRIIEWIVVGTYNLWMGILMSFIQPFLMMASLDDPLAASQLSWRDNAHVTLHFLLLNTIIFLTMSVLLVNHVAKSYRHQPPNPNADDNHADTTSTYSETNSTHAETECTGRSPVTSPLSVSSGSKARSKSSKSGLRLKFRRKSKEASEDDDSMM